MTIYEFMKKKENCHKLTFPHINGVSLVNACSVLETLGYRTTEIRMHQKLFSDFVSNAFSENAMKNSVYERTVRTMKFMNADVVIDNGLEDNIFTVLGKKEEHPDDTAVVKVFIGKC